MDIDADNIDQDSNYDKVEEELPQEIKKNLFKGKGWDNEPEKGGEPF